MPKTQAELDREIDEALREQREKAAAERYEMRMRRLGGARYRGGRPRPGGRGDV